MTPPLAARDPPLRGFERPFGPAIPPGREDACPVGERGERLDPQVNASLLSSRRQGLFGRISAREADIPSVGFSADRNRLRRTFQRARPAYGNAPNPREDQEAVVQPDAIFELRISEALVAIVGMDARIAGRLSFL